MGGDRAKRSSDRGDPFAARLAAGAAVGGAHDPSLLETVETSVHHYADWMLGGGRPPDEIVDAMGAEYAHQAQVQMDAAAIGGVRARAEERLAKGDGSGALQALLALPGDASGQALAQLGADDFGKVMGTLSHADRLKLRPLIDATHDPERKLELWGAGHTAESQREIREYEKAVAEGPAGSKAANEDRLTAARATGGEVANEVAYHKKQIAARAGSDKPVTEAEVQELIERKRYERMIERKHAINLTSDLDGTSADLAPQFRGTRSAWNSSELETLNSALDLLPAEHVRDNPTLHEIRRESARYAPDPVSGRWSPEPVAGDASHGGRVRVFDGGASPHALEEVVVHEIGHEASFASPDAHQALSRRANWREEGQNEAAAELTAFDPAAATRFAASPFTSENAGTRTYARSLDSYGSFDENSMPRGPGWDYSRTSPHEQFAELYAHSVRSPGKVYQDLVTAPAAATRTAAERLAQVSAADQLQGDAGLPMQMRQAMIIQKVALAAELENAQSRQRALADQRRLMRENVFGVDDAAIERHVGELRAAAGTDVEGARAAEATFRKEADQMMTPKQLRDLEYRLAGQWPVD
jgi:hypothetical protein